MAPDRLGAASPLDDAADFGCALNESRICVGTCILTFAALNARFNEDFCNGVMGGSMEAMAVLKSSSATPASTNRLVSSGSPSAVAALVHNSRFVPAHVIAS